MLPVSKPTLHIFSLSHGGGGGSTRNGFASRISLAFPSALNWNKTKYLPYIFKTKVNENEVESCIFLSQLGLGLSKV